MEQEISEVVQLEIESHKLREALDAVSKKLEIPFLKRRLNYNNKTSNPVDELNTIIEEISDRERELKACIGIANILIDTTEKSILMVKSQHADSEMNKEFLYKENQKIKEKLHQTAKKFERTNTALILTEEQLLKLNNDYQKILSECTRLKEMPDSLEDEVSNLKKLFRGQFENMYKDIFSMDRKNKEILTEFAELENLYQKKSEDYSLIYKKYEKSLQRID